MLTHVGTVDSVMGLRDHFIQNITLHKTLAAEAITPMLAES